MSSSMIMIIVFGIYIAGLFYIVFSNGKASSFEDFAVGGRMFSWPFITMTIIGTSYAGSVLTGYTQMGHDIGMTVGYYTMAVILGLIIFAVICGPIWKVGKRYNVKTLGEFLELRYGSKGLRIFVGITLLAVEIPWIITELLASGYAVQIITNGAISFNLGMIFIAILFMAYILRAGMKAVIFADYYQGWIFFILGSVLFLSAMYTHFGGFSEMWSMTRDLKSELLTIPGSSEGWWGEPPGELFYPSLILTASLGAYLYPSLFSRMMAAKSTKELKMTIQFTPFVAILFAVVVFYISVGVASLGEYGLEDSASAFIEFVSSMGPVAAALMSIIIIAGSLSMMDSMLSSWAIVFTNDVITPLCPKGISSEKQVLLSRVFIVVIGTVGLILAMTDLPTIVQMLTRVYQFIVQAFPLVVFGLFWKKANWAAAWAGTVSGMIVVTYFAFTQPDYIPMFNGLQGGVVGLIVNMIVFVVCSFIFKKGRGTDELFATYKATDEELEAEALAKANLVG